MSDSDDIDITFPFEEIDCSPDKAFHMMIHMYKMIYCCLEAVKIEYFKLDVGRFLIFFRDSDDVERCIYSCIKAIPTCRNSFKFMMVSKEFFYNNTRKLVDSDKEDGDDEILSYEGSMFEYVFYLRQHLTGLYVHPRKIDWFGTSIIEKDPPECFSQWMEESKLTLIYKIDEN